MGYFLAFNEFWSFLGFFPSLSNRWRSTQNNALEIHEDKSDFNGLFSKVWYFETLLPWGQLGTRRELLKTRGVQGFQDNRRQTFKHESHLKCSGFHIFPYFKKMKFLDLIQWGRVVVGNRWGVPSPTRWRWWNGDLKRLRSRGSLDKVGSPVTP